MSKKSCTQLYDVQKFGSIKELLQLAVQQAGDKIAFKYLNKKEVISVTYNEFQNATFYLGTALCNLQINGEHIANVGVNSYEWVTVYLTVLKSNSVYVPVDKELPFNDIINVVNDSDSTVLFYSSKYEKDIMENRGKFPNIKYFIGYQREEDEGEFLSYNKLIEAGKKLYDSGDRTYVNLTGDVKNLKMIVYTSGTTGISKGVMLSEHNLVSCVYHGLRVSTVYNCCLSVLPYHHTYEAVAGLLVSLHNHSTICINDSLKNVLKNLQRFNPDYIYLVPAFAELFYKKIWETAKQGKKDKALRILIGISNTFLKIGVDLRKILFKSIHQNFGGNLRKIVCGGAPIRNEIGKFFVDIGIPLINGYGITECSPLVSANREEFNDCSTVGLLVPCVEVKFINQTNDGQGEICVKGDTVMMGYYKRPDLTAEVLENGWFKTGDYGCMNSKNQLIITGRKKNIIITRNGKNIFPEEIEGYIQAIPYVKEVVVYALKDDSGNDTGLCAEVFADKDQISQFTEDAQAKLKKDISEALKELPAYKKVSVVKLRDTEFIKTTTNKIKRNLVDASGN